MLQIIFLLADKNTDVLLLLSTWFMPTAVKKTDKGFYCPTRIEMQDDFFLRLKVNDSIIIAFMQLSFNDLY